LLLPNTLLILLGYLEDAEEFSPDIEDTFLAFIPELGNTPSEVLSRAIRALFEDKGSHCSLLNLKFEF
jgi:hypothetical protein